MVLLLRHALYELSTNQYIMVKCYECGGDGRIAKNCANHTRKSTHPGDDLPGDATLGDTWSNGKLKLCCGYGQILCTHTKECCRKEP